MLNCKFERLTVIAKVDNIKNRTAWLCKCECGSFKIVKTKYLKDKSVKSCGCLLKNNSNHYKLSSAKKVWKRRYADGNISFNMFLKLSSQNCFYCNNTPNNIANSYTYNKGTTIFAKTNGNFVYNGLDRVNNSKPHNLNNVVTCCWKCNKAKRNMTPKNFYNWIVLSYNNIYGCGN